MVRILNYGLAIDKTINRSYLDILKWIALFAMTCFHIHYALTYSLNGWAINFGRIAFPIFSFILAWNIAAGEKFNKSGVESRLMRNLLAFGCFAQPFHWILIGSLLPLNVLFTLALGVYLIFNHRHVKTWLVVAFLGYFVDYGWFGVILTFSAYLLARDIMCRKLGLINGLLFSISLSLICAVLDSIYPLILLPLIFLGLNWKPKLNFPRCKWFFYFFYPIHLLLLVLYII